MNDTDRRVSWPPWFIWVACGIITTLQVVFDSWWFLPINVILWSLVWILGCLLGDEIGKRE
jgi:hypothetical protein